MIVVNGVLVIFDPVKPNPIEIKVFDKTVIGSVMDPTVSKTVGVNRPVTYVWSHSVYSLSTNPTAVGPRIVGNITMPTVLTAENTVNSYITNATITNIEYLNVIP